jgi:hypothetical protein
VLNDEARTASGLNLAAESEFDPNAPRYGEQAGIEHHPQITDYVPRRKRALIVALTAGLGVAGGTAALTEFAEAIAAPVPGLAAGDVRQLADAAAAWTSATALLLAASLARIIFSLRKHRVGDTKGRYRAWRWVGASALILSVNAVTGAHAIVASVLPAAVGWSLTDSGAEWWLAPAALVGGWIAVRMLLEVRESRASTAFAATGLACYAAAAAGPLGVSVEALGPWAVVLLAALPLAGYVFALVGLMLFARYVVLDVQGLIDHSPKRAAKPKRSPKVKGDREVEPADEDEPTVATIPARAKQSVQSKHEQLDADEAEWSDDEEEDYASGSQRLSKADRKRLRKQQRAA